MRIGSRRKSRKESPTKGVLRDAVIRLLEEMPAHEVRLEQVLADTGLTSGAVYHHFEDFPHLVESALAVRFARTVDLSIEGLRQVLRGANSRQEYVEGIKRLNHAFQAPERAHFRAERATAIALAQANPRMLRELAQQQSRLTDSLTELFAEAAEKGFMRRDIDPSAVSILMQALPLGRVVDDFAERRIDPGAWLRLVDKMVEEFFCVAPPRNEPERPESPARPSRR